MPYIAPEDQYDLDVRGLDELCSCLQQREATTGELNYCISRLITAFVHQGYDAPGYAEFNGVVGVLECAKLEFVRRVVSPYEDRKIAENGDIYG